MPNFIKNFIGKWHFGTFPCKCVRKVWRKLTGRNLPIFNLSREEFEISEWTAERKIRRTTSSRQKRKKKITERINRRLETGLARRVFCSADLAEWSKTALNFIQSSTLSRCVEFNTGLIVRAAQCPEDSCALRLQFVSNERSKTLDREEGKRELVERRGKKENAKKETGRRRRDEERRKKRERERTRVDITDFTDQLTNRLTCRVTSSIENYLTGTRCLVTVELRRNEIAVRPLFRVVRSIRSRSMACVAPHGELSVENGR